MGKVVIVVALGMVFYQMASTQVLLQDTIPHLNTHLGLSLLLIFLAGSSKAEKKSLRLWYLVLTFLGLTASLYIQSQWKELQLRAYFNTLPDVIIGVILILLSLEATRQELGIFLPLLILGVVTYPFLGHLLPEPFYCHSLGFSKTISKQAIALESGIFQFLSISTNYIFLFVLFGRLLQSLGGTTFFMEVARLISRKIRGGPAMMALASSAMVGTITGSGAANVVITGTFTIPLMKSYGYKPEHAGAIEAAASNGGQIMPPVMGMVAFGMAGITGIPYVHICAMAILPAILYFFCCGAYVYLLSGKLGIKKQIEGGEKNALRELLISSTWFIVPFTIIVVLLIKELSVMYVAFWANISLILLAFITRKRFGDIINGLVEGAKAGAGIAASVASVGMIATTFTTSGLGVKLASGIENWSGGNLFLALFIIWGVCILLGCVGLSLTAYIIVSIFAVAPLVKMGIPYEIAHFFVMYAAVFAFLTPPVAVVALIAARVAGALYIKTAIEATKAAFAAYILPFSFVYCPILLLKPQEPLLEILGTLSVIIGLFGVEIALVGYFNNRCGLTERMISSLVTVFMFLFVFSRVFLFFLTGIFLFGALTLYQRIKKKDPNFH